MIIGIEGQSDPDLFEVRHTDDAFGPFLGQSKRRQQQGRENRNDGDDYEQFNESEGTVPGLVGSSHVKHGTEKRRPATLAWLEVLLHNQYTSSINRQD